MCVCKNNINIHTSGVVTPDPIICLCIVLVVFIKLKSNISRLL